VTGSREMLDASPTGVPLGAAEVAAAIDACLDCLQSCTSCADADLVEDDVGDLSTCVALCVTCADVCDVTARVLSRPAHTDKGLVHRLLQACVRACTSSAEECHRHAAHHRHCAICEQVCRTCIDACNALLAAEAFAELE
jgi:hypothetical protein